MSMNRYRDAIAILAAVSLIAAAPPSHNRVKRVKAIVGQSGETTAATGGGAEAAGTVAGTSIFQGTWIWALAGLIAAGGLTAVALSGDGDPPVSPAS